MDVPDDLFDDSGGKAVIGYEKSWLQGGRIVINCLDVRGRPGLVAAWLLVESGVEPEEASRVVWISRPRALETPSQETNVLTLDGFLKISRVVQPAGYDVCVSSSIIDSLLSLMDSTDSSGAIMSLRQVWPDAGEPLVQHPCHPVENGRGDQRAQETVHT